jgi:YD repeat-containing protein
MNSINGYPDQDTNWSETGYGENGEPLWGGAQPAPVPAPPQGGAGGAGGGDSGADGRWTGGFGGASDDGAAAGALTASLGGAASFGGGAVFGGGGVPNPHPTPPDATVLAALAIMGYAPPPFGAASAEPSIPPTPQPESPAEFTGGAVFGGGGVPNPNPTPPDASALAALATMGYAPPPFGAASEEPPIQPAPQPEPQPGPVGGASPEPEPAPAPEPTQPAPVDTPVGAASPEPAPSTDPVGPPSAPVDPAPLPVAQAPAPVAVPADPGTPAAHPDAAPATTVALPAGLVFQDTAPVGVDPANPAQTLVRASDIDGHLPKPVALVSGNGLGLTGSSLDRLGAQGVLGLTARTTSGEALYVNTHTGNLVIQRTDELLVGLGPDAQVLRTYNSQATADGDNNDNWRIGFNRHLSSLSGGVNAAGSSVVRVEADGAQRLYTFDGTRYVNQDGVGAHDSLRFDAATGEWTWTDGSTQVSETYGALDAAGVGRLRSSRDLAGNALLCDYDAAGLLVRVTTANADGLQRNQTELVYNSAPGRGANLLELRTTAWNAQSQRNEVLTRTRYGYDLDNRLTEVTTDLSPDDNTLAATGSGDPSDGKTYRTTYTYDGASKRIASAEESNGARVSFSYDAQGRVSEFTEGGGRTTRLSYTIHLAGPGALPSSSTLVTDPWATRPDSSATPRAGSPRCMRRRWTLSSRSSATPTTTSPANCAATPTRVA